MSIHLPLVGIKTLDVFNVCCVRKIELNLMLIFFIETARARTGAMCNWLEYEAPGDSSYPFSSQYGEKEGEENKVWIIWKKSKFPKKEFLTIFLFRYLETQQVLSDMDRLLNKIASDPLADLVLPGFIKFFGRLLILRVFINYVTQKGERGELGLKFVIGEGGLNLVATSEWRHLCRAKYDQYLWWPNLSLCLWIYFCLIPFKHCFQSILIQLTNHLSNHSSLGQ